MTPGRERTGQGTEGRPCEKWECKTRMLLLALGKGGLHLGNLWDPQRCQAGRRRLPWRADAVSSQQSAAEARIEQGAHPGWCSGTGRA